MTDIVCPSGFAGTIRNMKAKEAQLLADKAKMKQGEAMNGLLAGCWLNTSSFGIYKDFATQGVNWRKVLVCDRFYALTRIRIATYGDPYFFKFRCENEACTLKKHQEWEVNLSELPVKALPETTKKHLLETGNRFEATLKDGRKLWFRLQDGEGEHAASLAVQEQKDLLVVAMRSRVLEVDGVDWANATKRDEFLGDMDMQELLDTVEKFDAVDGGVETNITVACERCDDEQVISLPFDTGFFLPRKK